MTKAEIITKAKLYLDDTSDLSDAEFSDLFDKIYNEVNTDHVWEGAKKEFSGTTSTSESHVDLPSDFLHLTANNNYTDNFYDAERPVVFRGSNYSVYEVVSWSDRRQYRNSENFAYVDYANNRLYFTKQPSSAEAVEFDYYAQMPDLGNNESPWFPSEFHHLLYHYMVSDDFMIQQSDKAKSYAQENRAAGDSIKERMLLWNSRLVQI